MFDILHVSRVGGLSKLHACESALDSSDAFEVLAGMKQREQQEALRLFKKGDINVIVCTSIGEEGLGETFYHCATRIQVFPPN